MRIITNGRLWLFAAIVATGLYLGGSAQAAAGDEGAYSCCGDSDCSVLMATSACPQGSSQCSKPATNCCTKACNDPHDGVE